MNRSVERPSGNLSGFRTSSSSCLVDAAWLWCLLVAAIVLMAGCTGDSASGTTSLSTTSTSGVTTSSSSTTSSSTSTTVDPIAEAKAEVAAAYYRSYEVFVGCYRSLPECDPETAFAEVYTGGTYERLTAGALQRKVDGLVFEAAENPDYARTEILDIDVNPNATEAVAMVCTFSDDTEFAIGDDGSRVPVDPNETVLVSWGEAHFVLEQDGVWRAHDFVTVESVDVAYSDIDQQIAEGRLCGEL